MDAQARMWERAKQDACAAAMRECRGHACAATMCVQQPCVCVQRPALTGTTSSLKGEPGSGSAVDFMPTWIK